MGNGGDEEGLGGGAVAAIVVAAFCVLSCAGCALVLRRRSRRLTDEQIREAGVDGHIRLVKALPQTARNEVSEAFKAGPDFRWMAAGDAAHPDFADAASVVSRQHHDLVYYMLECVFRFADRYCDILLYEDDGGEVLGSIIIQPRMGMSGLVADSQFLASVMPLGQPQCPTKEIRARFDAFGDLNKRHHEVMAGKNHWYVLNLGVSPRAQGKGVGRALLDAANRIAKEHPLYLECHDGNVAYYQKMGYDRALNYTLTPKGSDMTSFSYNSMVRARGMSRAEDVA